MKERGLVLGFYQDRAAAETVLNELRRQGLQRSATIHRDADDQVSIEAPPVRSSFDARNSPIKRYARWVVRNETLVIIEAGTEALVKILDSLRRIASEPPVTFIFPPELPFIAQPEDGIVHRPPQTLAHLRQAARRLTGALPAVSQPIRGNALSRRIIASETALKLIRDGLATTAHIGKPISMSADWLLDNGYLLQDHIDEFRRSLPQRYYDQLPVVSEGPYAGLPRIYSLACELIADTDTRIDSERTRNFFQAYQTITPLTIGELWAIPLMLRLRTIEVVRRLAMEVDRRERQREQADFWSNRLQTAARRDPERVDMFVKQMIHEVPNPSPHIADELVSDLYDDEEVLALVRTWLDQKWDTPLSAVIEQERVNQTAEQVALADAITSLRRLSELDWRDVFESLCRVDVVLREDPAAIYPHIDFATRDRYRHAVEEIARGSRHTEIEVAAEAVKLAAEGSPTSPQDHVGYYLIDKGRELLEARVAGNPRVSRRIQRWVRNHCATAYLGIIAALTLCVLAMLATTALHHGTTLQAVVMLSTLALLPASELAVQLVNHLVTHSMPPQFLPRMSFEEGIPSHFRTLVVVPMMLLTPDSIRNDLDHLEIRYLANPDPNLLYGLLSDFSDAPQKEMPDDVERLDVIEHGIRQLDARYGPGRFFLFHRERQWSESEQRWIGWERKRGKLEQLNCYLMTQLPGMDNDERQRAQPDCGGMLRIGDPEQLIGVRFVITLDSDTQLPRDTARHMVETLAHPLNRPHISACGMRVERGYTIIQPRVSTCLPSAMSTQFTRIFTDTSGTDPYTNVVSDVYQDLSGEGSYHGKGIYDLEAFHRVLSGRFPDAHLLSHDLLEGAHARVGLASDIQLLDLFPADYQGYSKRQHRWVRGDWQIVDWLVPRVPPGSGALPESALNVASDAMQSPQCANTLSLLNRWKIADNLRRSLLPVSLLALLLAAWAFSPIALEVSLFVALVLLLSPIMSIMDRLASLPRRLA
jgi:cyclic beta-1,2-glucan synthetase